MKPSDFDQGLQPERTELAWRRTMLSIAVGSIVAMRLLPTILGNPFWFLPGLIGLVGAVTIWRISAHRYRRVSHATITHGDRAILPDGKLTLALTLMACGIGMFGLVVIALVAVHASH
ncbi:DUF202 domain-containing protein [Microbacterium sp. NPDC076911]|uniref:DUF202 domain-containing protein n=1 Tax=Microbacterium sp. NPDC076911 TaxID=3154958 RepID=UPI0034361B9E